MCATFDKLAEQIRSRPERIPRHIAIIMDGNGRWAAQRNKPRTFGHEQGVLAVKEVVRAAGRIGIGYLTLYTFSSENWKRPRTEVAALLKLLTKTTRREIDELIREDVKLITTGRIDGLSVSRRNVLKRAVEATKDNRGMVLNLALNYGGRKEILDAVKSIANAVRAGMVDVNEIDEGLFSSFLYTADLPDPDLLIRTSGEMRLSNFLLWQTSYTEIHIIDTLWPDFGQIELCNAVLDYQSRERRFGKVGSKGSS